MFKIVNVYRNESYTIVWTFYYFNEMGVSQLDFSVNFSKTKWQCIVKDDQLLLVV